MAGKTISRQQLYDEIWSISAIKVAEKYEINYSRYFGVREHEQSEEYKKLKKKGYWY